MQNEVVGACIEIDVERLFYLQRVKKDASCIPAARTEIERGGRRGAHKREINARFSNAREQKGRLHAPKTKLFARGSHHQPRKRA